MSSSQGTRFWPKLPVRLRDRSTSPSAASAGASLVIENVPVAVPTIVVVALMAPMARDNLLAGCGLSLVALTVHLCVAYLARRDTVELLVGAATSRQTA